MNQETTPPSGQKTRIGAFTASSRGALERGGQNIVASRDFLSNRKRDQRFDVVPFSALQIANLLAIMLTVLLLFLMLLDGSLVAWRTALPDSVKIFFYKITDVAKPHWVLVGTGLMCVLTLVRDSSALGSRQTIRRTVRAWAAFYVFASVALSGILVNVLKYSIGRARPKLFESEGIFAFVPFSFLATWGSFPSGHATTASSFSVAMALLFPRYAGILISAGLLVAVSRLVVGAHYPSDVLGGCILGALLAWLLARYFASQRLVFGFNKKGQLVRRQGASGQLL